MRPHRTLYALAAATMLTTALPVVAAERGVADGAPYAVEPETAQRSRALTEAACAQAGDVAAALTQNLQALQGEMWRAFQQAHVEATRELAPLMHRFADQLRDLARQLDSAPHDS